MSLHFHEIGETNHRILNPFTEEQLMLLGEICRLDSGIRQLDLCCGKGEMLCRWSERYGILGVGVDISKVFLDAAYQRAHELGVSEKIMFVEGNAADYPEDHHQFDIVSCIGATWIGGGLVGTLKLMLPALKGKNSLLLVGEPFWIEEPPAEAYDMIADGDRELFATLTGIYERFQSLDLELVEMVLADHHGWDRYVSMQWMAVSDWLRQNPDDADAEALREWIENSKREYFTYGRRYLGWGVFVLRQL